MSGNETMEHVRALRAAYVRGANDAAYAQGLISGDAPVLQACRDRRESTRASERAAKLYPAPQVEVPRVATVRLEGNRSGNRISDVEVRWAVEGFQQRHTNGAWISLGWNPTAFSPSALRTLADLRENPSHLVDADAADGEGR